MAHRYILLAFHRRGLDIHLSVETTCNVLLWDWTTRLGLVMLLTGVIDVEAICPREASLRCFLVDTIVERGLDDPHALARGGVFQ